MASLIFQGVLLGLGATVAMDLWAMVLARFSGQNPPNWAPVGRWFWHLRDGKLFHEDIGKAAPYAHELPLGWIGHYAVGILYGVGFALIAGERWLAAPSLLPAWLFSIATVAFGWFLLQPGLGLGWAASRTANPGRMRLRSLATHTVFGLGLYGTALLIRQASGL